MGVSEVVFTSICDVQNVSNSKRLDNVSIARMVPVAQVETAWENFIGVGVRIRRSCDKGLAIRTYAKVFVVCCYFVETADTEVELS